MATIIVNELNISQARSVKKIENIQDVGKYLLNQGLKKVGSGHFTNVYAKPGSNVVVRVTQFQDSCWLKFYEYVVEHYRTNTHLPKVGKIKKFIDSDTEEVYFLLFMERLEKIEHQEAKKIIELLDVAEYMIKNPNSVTISEKEEIEQYLTPELIELYNDINYNSGFCDLDLHGENIMRRPSTKEIVIIDPYSNEDEIFMADRKKSLEKYL